ncbi:MAG: hypothetical protein KJ887_04695 [Candidatus Omnitrophica bacterium]|nr:hypothetical protein [Candidatus Omnitrophota bacterium]MBU1047613.1 hypothetical protein [Candidatus Omnitrophota bacterium]MBU1631479.1 hypothetical protein [Candidatus Omnitrophota bacterium]MBU1767247.1 hypothetical protein [Candidatus Omnitrophota bacterium]MBU1888975.1 hypothetical protein [Candidatus Omnitrophota bacterium]
MAQRLKLEKTYRDNLGKWVAVDSKQTKVMGVGKTLEEASQKAARKGEKHPIFLQVPSSLESIVL